MACRSVVMHNVDVTGTGKRSLTGSGGQQVSAD